MKPYSPPLSLQAFRPPVPVFVYGVLGLIAVVCASSPGTYVFSALPLFAGTAYFVWSLQRAKATVYFALRDYARTTELLAVFARQLEHDYGERSANRKVRIAYAEAVNFYTKQLYGSYVAARGMQFALFAIVLLIACAMIGVEPALADRPTLALGALFSLPMVPELWVLHMLFRSHRSDMTKWVTARLGLH